MIYSQCGLGLGLYYEFIADNEPFQMLVPQQRWSSLEYLKGDIAKYKKSRGIKMANPLSVRNLRGLRVANALINGFKMLCMSSFYSTRLHSTLVAGIALLQLVSLLTQVCYSSSFYLATRFYLFIYFFTCFLWHTVECIQVQEVYDEAGVLGFWKGLFPTLIMVGQKLLFHLLNEYRWLFLLLVTGE